jgi:hypothetical protein
MKVLTILLVAYAMMPNYAMAQRESEGYIVLNSGDTLHGRIKIPSAVYLLHHHINFRPDREERRAYKFTPDELKAFQIGDHWYESRYIWEDEKLVKKFLKPRVRGYCTLYEYAYTTKSSRGMVSTPLLAYFVERRNERLHALDFQDLRKGKDPYFDDNPALAQDIRQGKYPKEALPQVVERYNRERIINN